MTERLDALGLDERVPARRRRVRSTSWPARAPGATVLLRADLDALPVHESARDDVASVVDGRMHACGHDAHTAAMLGVARGARPRDRDELAGPLRLRLPARRGVPRGRARRMVDGGVLDGLDATAVIGCHVTTMAPVGLVALRDGRAHVRGALVHRPRPWRRRPRRDGRRGLATSCSRSPASPASSARSSTGMSHDGTACACSAGDARGGHRAERRAVDRPRCAGRCGPSPPSSRRRRDRRAARAVRTIGRALRLRARARSSATTPPPS